MTYKHKYKFVLRSGGDFTIDGNSVALSKSERFFLVFSRESQESSGSRIIGSASAEDVISLFVSDNPS